jgi:hypothetical protein
MVEALRAKAGKENTGKAGTIGLQTVYGDSAGRSVFEKMISSL